MIPNDNCLRDGLKIDWFVSIAPSRFRLIFAVFADKVV